MAILSPKNFTFYQIDNENVSLFKCAESSLSDFHCFALCKCAEAIAQKDTILVNNRVWWDDGVNRKSLYMTTNGILVYEDVTNNKLYRIEFNK